MVRVWPGWVLGLLVLISPAAAAQERSPPPKIELRENFPNPFYPSTTIPFFIHPDLCAGGHQPLVSVRIYNVLVQVIAVPVLVSPAGTHGTADLNGERIDKLRLGCGEHQAFWDGKYLDGTREVTQGVYYSQLIVDGQRTTRKMIVQP